MTTAAAPIDVGAYLAQHEAKDLLRFITCGSVDDGKSTLIGRLLHETGNVFIDQASALVRDSLKHGNAGKGEIDYSLLLDGLKAEREQGITIDVAYRYFTTPRRKYIIADCPGHEQYTRNMVTGASTADLAIVLIDARHGVLRQTKRHSYLVNLLGIRQVLVAINKMDLVGWDQAVYDRIVADYQDIAAKLPHSAVDYRFIPIAAKLGDNVVERSAHAPWYSGEPLLELLETASIAPQIDFDRLFFPVQYVIRPHLDFRGYGGTLLSGILRRGQRVTALPSGVRSTVKDIVTFDGSLPEAFPPQAVTVTLTDEVDISRGDVLVNEDSSPQVGAAFEAMLVWLAEQPLAPNRSYLVKHLGNTVGGQVTEILYRVDPNTLEHGPATNLELNSIAKVHVRLDRSVVFDLYRANRQAGAFIVIDRITNGTVGAGMITARSAYEAEHLRRIGQRNAGDPVTAEARAARHNQRPAVVWLSGKDQTQALHVARELEKHLFDAGFLPYLLDLASISLDLRRLLAAGSADPGPLEGVRWALALSRLAADAGLVTLAVVGDRQRGDGDLALEVSVDADPLRQGKDLADLVSRAPQLKYPDGGADARRTAAAIADFLRQERIVGYFRDDEQVVI